MSTTKALSAAFLIIIALGALAGAIGMLFAPAAQGEDAGYDAAVREDTEYVTWVKTPAQEKAETPPQFIIPEPVPFVMPEGVNIAYRKPINVSGYTDVYPGKNAVDGRDRTYWEGSEFPSVYTIDLCEDTAVKTLVLQLPPLRTWGKRTQTLGVSMSNDGESYTELAPVEPREFDTKTGNAVQFDFADVSARFIRIEITANTGANGGQLSEISVFN